VAKMIKPRCKVLKPKLLSQVVRSGAVGLKSAQSEPDTPERAHVDVCTPFGAGLSRISPPR
jgi:hypothetical protein